MTRPEFANRVGTVLRIEGWPVVRGDRTDGEGRVPWRDLEVVG